MLFNSAQFVLFFAVVVLAYFGLPHRLRWVLLLAASYVFYMSWRVEYALLILASTFIDYIVGLNLDATEDHQRRRALVALSVAANLGTLGIFKYWGFFSTTVAGVGDLFGLSAHLPAYDMLLPVGISFYTFQSMSYTIDVYRRQRPAERHFGMFAVYVAFFPQLVAGPIERSTRLLPQFHDEHRVDLQRFGSGLELMLWGTFKKVVIADNAAVIVDVVYTNPGAHAGPLLLLATFFFALQIYCDFSGYSDVAIGAARVMGFDLMLNFRRPYFSRSLVEFWRRWHISLSTWFRDYVYVPLGGNRVSRWRHALNLMVVFVLSGLWHGAAWTFIIWGALHGAYLVAEVWLRPWVAKLPSALTSGLVGGLASRTLLLTFVLLTWVFFRANSLDDAWTVLSHLGTLTAETQSVLTTRGLPRLELIVLLGGLAVLLLVDLSAELRPAWLLQWWARRPVRWGACLAVTWSVLIFGAFGGTPSIYFQF